MKRMSAAALMLALSTGTGFAADLPSFKAPAAPPPPAILPWAGFYIGGSAGYAWDGSNSIQTVGAVAAPFGVLGGASSIAAAASANSGVNAPADGFVRSGELGYNYVFGGGFLAGVEADFSGLAMRGRGFAAGAATAAPDTASTALDAQKIIDWLGTVRGRVGYLVTPSVLVFGSGGFAYGRARADVHLAHLWAAPSCLGANCFLSVGGIGNYSDVRTGWAAGGGAEWMALSDMSLRLEYLYFDLGGASFTTPWAVALTAPLGPGAGLFVATHRARFDGHIVRAGLDWHFDYAKIRAIWAGL